MAIFKFHNLFISGTYKKQGTLSCYSSSCSWKAQIPCRNLEHARIKTFTLSYGQSEKEENAIALKPLEWNDMFTTTQKIMLLWGLNCTESRRATTLHNLPPPEFLFILHCYSSREEIIKLRRGWQLRYVYRATVREGRVHHHSYQLIPPYGFHPPTLHLPCLAKAGLESVFSPLIENGNLLPQKCLLDCSSSLDPLQPGRLVNLSAGDWDFSQSSDHAKQTN